VAIINRVATGLLSLLDTKSQGVTPPAIEESVRPTMELGELYASNLGYETVVGQTVTVGIAAIGFHAPVTVPAGELWRVRGIALNTFNLLVGTYAFGIAIQTIPGAVPSSIFRVQDIGPALAVTAAITLTGRAITFDTPFYFKSGVEFGAMFAQVQNSAIDVTTTVLINRLTA